MKILCTTYQLLFSKTPTQKGEVANFSHIKDGDVSQTKNAYGAY